jgi:amidohydrolase
MSQKSLLSNTKPRLVINHPFILFCVFLSLFNPLLYAQTSPDTQLRAMIAKEYQSLENLYKHLHANPELSLHEKQTSELLSGELKKAGFQVTTDIGGYGIVGVLKNGPGPVVMVRTDMDALPLKENTGADFASKQVFRDETGKESAVMHACGHDMHMAVWVGVARMLTQMKKEWSGTVVLIGQPAEEPGVGAVSMLADGLFTKFPKPDYALALHVNSALESGKVGLCSGYVLANINALDIVVKGKGGHGSVPQLTIDPIVLASKMVLGFQTIISREIGPQVPALITVGSIHGGTNDNIIPDEVKLELSIRSFSDDVQKMLIDKIKRTCEGIAFAAGVEPQNYPEVTIRKEFTPAVYNDPELTKRISDNFVKVFGQEKVVSLSSEMFGEDFGWYGRQQPAIPTLIYSLGSVNPDKMANAKKTGKSPPSTHSSVYLPDMKPGLELGVLSMTTATLSLLKK